MYHIFQTVRCTSPKIWEENGGASYSSNVAYLAGWGVRGRWWSGVTRGRSRVAAAGSWWGQKWGDAAGPGLGGGCVSWWCEASEAGVEFPLWHTIVLGRRLQVVQIH